MIIGTIIDVSSTGTGEGNNSRSGGSSVIFYTENDCVDWCSAMSEIIPLNAWNCYCVTVFYNTDTRQRRWWFNGTEYTG